MSNRTRLKQRNDLNLGISPVLLRLDARSEPFQLFDPSNHFRAYANITAVIVYLIMIFKAQTRYIEVINLMRECGKFETGSVIEWIVFEIVAFYVNIIELTVQCILYSYNLKAVKLIYNVKLVTRI